jgi:hypothetical protein
VPFPSPECLEFGSSTASVISEYAYAHAARVRARLVSACAVEGVEGAFERATESTRVALKRNLGLGKETEIIFSPSGTDAQLQALFVTKALLGTPLVTISVMVRQSVPGLKKERRSKVSAKVCGRLKCHSVTSTGGCAVVNNWIAPYTGLSKKPSPAAQRCSCK